jgi:biotin carboxyl carrier protein
MLKKLKITVDGRPYTVTVEDVSDEGSHWYPEPGMTAEATAPAPAPAAARAPAPAAAPAAAAAGPGDEVSPLSGVVVSIDVTVGQEVKEGDKIATLEAMKMKTVVSAHRSGKVSNIAVKAGDGVEAGQVLLTIS